VLSSPELLCRNLVILRERHNLSQEQAATLTGMEYKYYQHVEAGRKTRVRLDTLDKIAHAYGLSGFELISPEPPKSKINRTPAVGKRSRKASVVLAITRGKKSAESRKASE
jgi:transcriptional regulator with XRE-family HTH domain